MKPLAQDQRCEQAIRNQGLSVISTHTLSGQANVDWPSRAIRRKRTHDCSEGSYHTSRCEPIRQEVTC
jgi:hypothetical protein